MRPSILARAVPVLAALTLATAARADHHTVKVAKGDKGSYLTDAKGMALYTFTKDSPGASACSGDCAVRWPPFFREKVGVTGDLKQDDFTTISREDGKQQTAYRGKPLYYFAGDKSPKDTTGEGVKDVWHLAKP